MAEERPVVVVLVAEGEADPPGLEPLAQEAELRVVRTREQLDRALEDARVLAVYDFRTTLVPHAVKHAPRLEWIHAASAGLDAVMVPEVTERALTVTNSRGVFDAAIAEYVLGAVLAFAKDLSGTLRLQQARRWEHRDSERVAGRRLLVVGAGSIGRAVGRLASAAGLEIRGVARRERTEDPDFGRVAPQDELRELLPWADFVVLCVPLSEETQGLIGAEELAAMRPGARLINVARGPIVDDSALIQALRAGRIAGALLDVFDEEPLPPDHPFWAIEQVIVSPHMAGDAHGWQEALGALFVENFRRWRRGAPLRNVIQG